LTDAGGISEITRGQRAKDIPDRLPLEGRVGVLERGELGFHPSHPPRVSKVITADLFWLAPEPLRAGTTYAFRCNNAELSAQGAA
jgi:sulfate adenylyltransferase subunit 1 (EFTu-like GTPase family)